MVGVVPFIIIDDKTSIVVVLYYIGYASHIIELGPFTI